MRPLPRRPLPYVLLFLLHLSLSFVLFSFALRRPELTPFELGYMIAYVGFAGFIWHVAIWYFSYEAWERRAKRRLEVVRDVMDS